MTNQPNFNNNNLKNENSESQNGKASPVIDQSETALKQIQSESKEYTEVYYRSLVTNKSLTRLTPRDFSFLWLIVIALVVMILGVVLKFYWVGISGTVVVMLLSLRVLLPSIKNWVTKFLTPQERIGLFSTIAFLSAIAVLAYYLGIYKNLGLWLERFKYDEFGSWAEWVGALGQISIAMIAVYVAWEQYVISKDLTTQQNRITQQQTIDAYFQGVSDLALNGEGMLEDWPQERAIAEGRTAAIMGSIDAEGKAKVLRFLSRAKLIVPLMRDSHLGRPILDGYGGYAEDRAYGVRVINLGVMLAGADLSAQDLRWTDLSEANMVRANISRGDLVKANLSRTILYEGNLSRADLKGTRFFYGSAETASPRSRIHQPNYETGEYTGAVIEKVNFSGVQNLNEQQRYYCCAWGGEKTRSTIPGGCEDIPNKLGR